MTKGQLFVFKFVKFEKQLKMYKTAGSYSETYICTCFPPLHMENHSSVQKIKRTEENYTV